MLLVHFARLTRPISSIMRRSITIKVVVADPVKALSEAGLSVSEVAALGGPLIDHTAAAAAAASVTTLPSPESVSFDLTEKEESVFGILRDASSTAGKGTAVRIVGGWVRDKLLRLESADIDVALDNTTGVEFAGCVNALLTARGEPTSSVGVIEANPEQSKHLETAATRVFGEWIDFVGLRAEVYDDDSRIPTIKAGTPTQDALRRDFTVNALFYNLSTESLEDLTGRGLNDLTAHILRTPLPPLITFRDDPLRVLRAVRFATRLGFVFDDSLRAAAADVSVATNLDSKVSRERVGIELDGMMGGARPFAAVRTLHALGLANCVFAPPKTALERLAGTLIELPLTATATSTALSLSTKVTNDALSLTSIPINESTTLLPERWLHAGAEIVNALDFLCAALGTDGLASLCAMPPPLSSTTATTATTTSLLSPPPIESKGVGIVAALEIMMSHTTQPPEASSDHAIALYRILPRDGVRSLLIAAQLLPLACITRASKGTTVAGAPNNPKLTRGPNSLPSVTLIEGLKRPKKAADDVTALLSGALGFSKLLCEPEMVSICKAAGTVETGAPTAAVAAAGHTLVASSQRNAVVLAAGGILRRDVRELWRGAILLSAAAQCAALLRSAAAAAATTAAASSASGSHSLVDAIGAVLEDHSSLARAIASVWSLDGCWAWRPPLNGMELKAALGAGGAVTGPAFGALMEEQALWQLLHPTGSAEEFLMHMRGGRMSGGAGFLS